MEWWSGGVVEWWSGGVVEWWELPRDAGGDQHCSVAMVLMLAAWSVTLSVRILSWPGAEKNPYGG
jgi:hypothetical protein